MPQTAFITGISGQDGCYLAVLLLSKGYRVIGLTRSYQSSNLGNLNYLNILEKVTLEECDLLDMSSIIKLIQLYNPDEIYNLTAQSSVFLSFKQAIGTFQFNTISVLNLLEAIKITNRKIRMYQASSSEMFGDVKSLPITEDTEFYPKSPYAISKAAAHWCCVNYRESYDIFVSCGILFNHESYLRSNNFFIKKLITNCIKIKNKEIEYLEVGNLDIKRDFGYSPKYVEAMYLMLQNDIPQNLLICSGKSISLREITEHICSLLDISINCIRINKDYFRPSEILEIYGSPEKAQKVLGWDYKMDFKEVLTLLLKEELENQHPKTTFIIP